MDPDWPTSSVSSVKGWESPLPRLQWLATCSEKESISQIWSLNLPTTALSQNKITLASCFFARWPSEAQTRSSMLTTTPICFLLASTQPKDAVEQLQNLASFSTESSCLAEKVLRWVSLMYFHHNSDISALQRVHCLRCSPDKKQIPLPDEISLSMI